MTKLNDTLLLQFANTFYGYGNYQAPYWFLGMEEGGGNSVDEINRRFSAWELRGCVELEDIAEYHSAIGIPEYFDEKPKIQNTWGKQIRFLFGAEHRPVDREIVRNYQREYWGRRNSNNCVIDLFPLPSPSTSDWIYANASTLESLKDRETYRKSFLQNRTSHIRDRIIEYEPKIVCAFGISYMNYWEILAGNKFHEEEKFFYTNLGNTMFVITQHPTAFGVTNKYFYDIARTVARKLDE